MPHYKKLVGEKCYLSPCSLEDAEKWAAWFNDLEITLPLGDEAYIPFSLPNAQTAVEATLKQQEHFFSIVDLETEACIGRTVLFGIDQINRHAKFGIFIGEKSFWGKGYGQEATRLSLDYAFNLLNLNSVMLGVFAFNKRAIRAYENVGFKLIGIRRQARIIGGQKFDAYLMDILAEEFEGTLLKDLMRNA